MTAPGGRAPPARPPLISRIVNPRGLASRHGNFTGFRMLAARTLDAHLAGPRPDTRMRTRAPAAAELRPWTEPGLAAEWEALARNAGEPNAFAERWFVEAGLAHLAGDVDVRLLAAHEDGALIGLLPVCVAPRFGRLPVPHVTNWLHHNAFLGTPLLARGRERAAWGAMLDALDASPWARGFLHLDGLVEDGPAHCALREVRTCDTVHRAERALLQSDLGSTAYYEATVRKKKRKELKRLQSRLAELGKVTTRRLAEPGELWPWCDTFLGLERSGWKGRAGSAIASDPANEAFFRAALAGAWEAGRLEMLRMDLADRPIAMLVNFLAPPGSFSFKIAFDEAFARFSPGVLIQLDNYAILDRAGIDWMDSCAAANHPMINSLWAERRRVVRVSVPLAGAWRGAQFRLVRTAERASAALRRRGPAPQEQADD